MSFGAQRGHRFVLLWIAAGLAGFFLLPWYAIEDGFFSFDWLYGYPFEPPGAPAIAQVLLHQRAWLWPVLPALIVPLFVARRPRGDLFRARVLVVAAGAGLLWMAVQGFAIGPLGFSWEWTEGLFGPLGQRQFGMGVGALFVGLALILLLSEGLGSGALGRSDAFIAGALALCVTLVAAFVLYPVAIILLRAFETDEGGMSFGVLVRNLSSRKVWEVTWHSIVLGLCAAAGSTLLGLILALAVVRTKSRWLKSLRLLSVLPVITPPFVIGLALVLAFGRAGAVTAFVADLFGLQASRYIFGFPGLLLAQLLSFTPIAFLILVGVLEGVSPSLEEASQTLRAGSWRTFRTVTLPLIRPGLANAFLVGFVESLADFGNALVLAGSKYEVLATEIYFSVAGAQGDIPRAAAMAMLLLAFTLTAFLVQQRWVGNARYTTVSGKGDSGLNAPLPKWLTAGVVTIAVSWTLFTLAMYGLVIAGGFVKLLGRDNSFTLEHYRLLFDVVETARGWEWSGRAWHSLGNTILLAAIAAPLTAVFGILTAYLLERQSFRGRKLFEFATMLSFAVPGTVIGVAYVLAFNMPPFDLIGTGAVLVICFIFRNMPVGIRSGVSALSQIDPSLDEASLTLRATTARTLQKVVLPLLRPAIVTALVYGFVRAMTAVSAVIFLVSAEHSLSTTYILGQVETGEYGGAIAYSSVLIVFMLGTVAAVQWALGRRQLGRRAGT